MTAPRGELDPRFYIRIEDKDWDLDLVVMYIWKEGGDRPIRTTVIPKSLVEEDE